MAQQEAHLGFWIDRSRHPVLGATFTLDIDRGAYLISGLTLLVTLAGQSFWSILAFAIHQYRANTETHDAAFYQHQVILRNSASALTSGWTLLKSAYAWRKASRSALWRTLGLASVPLFTYIVFAFCGVFQARIASKPYHVNLVRLADGGCGILQTLDTTFDTVAQLASKKANDTRIARTYANQCYGKNSGALGCTLMPTQYLNYTSKTDAFCPFKPAIRCVVGYNGAVSFDTGFIDSHKHLGINAPTKDRLQTRIVRTCSVLHHGDLYTTSPDTSTKVDLFISYSVGYSLARRSNTTFLYSSYTATSQTSYELFSVFAYAGGDNDLILHPDFNRTDADVSFHFFSPNSVNYIQPVFDPFYSANGTNILKVNTTIYYQPDTYVHIMGCTDQNQFREPVNNLTTPLTGLRIAQPLALLLGLNLAQRATLTRLGFALQNSDTYNTINGQNGDALAAQNLLYQLISPGLPDNQWQIEVRSWFETTLANIQHQIVDFVSNTWTANGNNKLYLLPPTKWTDSNGPALQAQCTQQLIQSSANYTSFSALGLIITVVCSVVIIVISLVLQWCVSKERKKETNAKYHKYVAYNADDELQLLRMVLEHDRDAAWTGTEDGIPILASADAGHEFPAPTHQNQAFRYLTLPPHTQAVAHPAAEPQGPATPPIPPPPPPVPRSHSPTHQRGRSVDHAPAEDYEMTARQHYEQNRPYIQGDGLQERHTYVRQPSASPSPARPTPQRSSDPLLPPDIQPSSGGDRLLIPRKNVPRNQPRPSQ